MEVNFFSTKSQSLAILTCSPSLSWFNSPNLRYIRRQFLRPPRSATRRKCKKLDLTHTRASPPQFVVRASLDPLSNSVFVVVALAAFTAVSVAYFNFFLKNSKNSKEVSGSSSHALSQLGRNTLNHTIESQNVSIGDLYQETSEIKNECLIERETNQASEKQNAHLQFQETTSVDNYSILTEMSDSLGAESAERHVSSASSRDSLEESDSTNLPLTPYELQESGILQPLIFATEMSELQFEKDKKDTDLDTDLPGITADIQQSITSLVPETDVHTEVDEQTEMHHKLVEEAELTTHYNVFQESVRKEQYAFSGPNQSVLKFPANLDAVKAISSHASSLNNFTLFSLRRNAEIEGPELSVQDAFQTAEYDEGKITLSHKGGHSLKRKDIRRGRNFPGDKERRYLIHENNKNLLQCPYPNGMHANEMHLAEQLSAYNRLLRVGRLTDCIDLLEDMDRRGLLDMNKVYHARFFNTCKSQKATKEAFRFFKLISNPTLSTFNMLMSVCASSQDLESAFQVLQLVQESGLKVDCKLYTTLISTCAKSGKVDAMFEVFHEMVNAGVEPNIHTYGALINGCAKAGQVAKSFGAYGIMRSKNVKPDRVVFNALITACGQSGAVDRAFDVLAEMGAETHPVDPDHITIGALIKACANAGQVNRAKEVYKMIHKYNIKGTPEVYTIAVNCCSQTGDWNFACSVYADMTSKGVVPDEVFLSALIDVAGHAGKVDAAFEIIQEAKTQGIRLGIVSYSSLMGACSNAKNWQKALELYENMKSIKLNPTVSTMNALITALCDGDQLPKAMEVLSEMKRLGLCPNTITYSILLVASEKKDDIEVGVTLLSQAKEDGVTLNLVMFKCIIGMCLRRFEKARSVGEDIFSLYSGRPQIQNKWTSLALFVYREMVVVGTTPTMEVVSQVFGCLQLPYDADLKSKLVENLGVSPYSSRSSNLYSLIDGFGEYDARAFSLLEEAASLGIVPCVSFKESPIVVDARKLQIHTAEVYLLTVLKGLKHRLAAGAKLPNITILLPVEKTQIMTVEGDKAINVAERITQAVAALLRRLGLAYQGKESYGKIRINGLVLRRWFQPKLASPFSGKPGEARSSQLGKGISYQQRYIRTGNLSLE